ncbi:helix-turn-helix transcriptional regulator [Oceanobacillus alkalisoli]|uniref:helix-turn-helix transcriptional regulator n=1 Tax=Oceanobacillus alkalisoli TaxID=2925113 RepID=UPI001EF05EAF|nr:DeoR family transcriptional regulator [Oceanobacillus alkalisoli]MCF3943260.1 helix-turn-helix transcriptional regulator [Oceanobacillus alkalisoli]MCG5103863.1 helix-turn-helix transcriptional regulator [Oceanobacillus alkalisoli]
MKKTTKERLILILKKNKAVTMDELMAFFTISEPAVRKHLHELESEELIKKRKHKQKIGRPFYTYELTEKGHGQFPNQYEQLPVELLHDLEELQGPELVTALLDKRMEREEDELLTKLDGKDFDEKVHHLVEAQNNVGYMIEVEKTSDGDYILTNYNCPIVNIAKAYQQVCSNEKIMYNRLFHESNVVPEEYITTGSHICRWVIKAPKKDD